MIDGRDKPSNASDVGVREASMPVKQYNIASIRNLLQDAFTADDLWRFCQERPALRPVLARFKRDSSLESMIDVLTEYCRTQDLFPELLSEIRAYNPKQYQRYSQYLWKVNMIPDSPPGTKISPARAGPQSDAKARTRVRAEQELIFGEEAASKDESMIDEPQESPLRGGQNVHIEGPIQANDVIVAQGDVHLTKGNPPSSIEISEPDRGLVRVMALVVGIAGLVGAVIWLQKAVPGLTPEFLIPLFIIIAAVVLGVMGLLKPEQIAVILMGWRDGKGK